VASLTETYDLFQEGRRHLRAGRADEATGPLEQARAREPHSRSIREALGIAYFRTRRWEEAEAEFRMLAELSPDDEFAHYALGRTLSNLGRGREAIPHLKLAHSLRRRPVSGDVALDPGGAGS
jgi:Flp pilus assembly protein TadD